MQFNLSDEEHAWLERIRRIAPQVFELQEQSKSPLLPEPGSSLGADSFSGVDVDKEIWYLISVSAEHLGFVIKAMDSTNTLFPTAYLTVVRTAFLSAANAAWILFGETREERRRRVVVYKAEGIRMAQNSANELIAMDEDFANNKESYLNYLKTKKAELEEDAKRVELNFDFKKSRMNQTDVIKCVSKMLFTDDGVEGVAVRQMFATIWRQGSMAAHGFSQFAVGRTTVDTDLSEEQEFTIGYLTADLEHDLGPALTGTWMLLSKVHDRYDKRRRNLLAGKSPRRRGLPLDHLV